MSHHPWDQKTVIVVDDSDNVRKELVRLFESMGMNVIAEAADGISAAEKYLQLKPDLISLDIIMPEMNGIDCYRKIAQENPDLKAIIITFLNKKSLEVDLTKTIPSYVFVEKPATEEKVQQALEDIFASSHKPVLARKNAQEE